MNDYINYYDLLGVKKDATDAEIKKAYITQIKKWHPDLNKDPQAEEISKSLNEAKEILLDPTKRKDYDYYLENRNNESYDNLRQKHASKSNQSNQTYQQYQQQTYQEEKTYTKWEYFKLYIKYYNVSVLRKIIGTIFVLIETLLCSLLQLINIIISYTVVYLYELLAYFFIYGTIIYSGYFIGSVMFLNKAPTTTLEWIKPIGIFLFFVFGVFLLPMTPNFLMNKMPVYISKLNIFLFKKSIGYK